MLKLIMTKFYLVVMQRYGNPDGHCYFIGLSKNRAIAGVAGRAHRDYRGGKYEAHIIELERDEDKPLLLIEQYEQKDKYSDIKNYYVSLMNSEEKKRMEERVNPITEIRHIQEDDYLQISDEDVIHYMRYIPHGWFTEEEENYLKDIYEKIVRKQYKG
jgi:hypothetical protein